MNLEKLLDQAITKSGYSSEKILMQKPKHDKFGDYSTPVAMQIAKKISKNPMEIANNIIKNLPIADYISKAEVVNPGFINVYLNKDYSFDLAKKLLDEKYIKNEVLKKITLKLKDGILVEHTHVNPSKSMHIGHLRNTFIGDSLVRLYRFLGLKAYALYYQNNTCKLVFHKTLKWLAYELSLHFYILEPLLNYIRSHILCLYHLFSYRKKFPVGFCDQ